MTTPVPQPSATNLIITLSETTSGDYAIDTEPQAPQPVAHAILPRPWVEAELRPRARDLAKGTPFTQDDLKNLGSRAFEALLRDEVRDAYRDLLGRLGDTGRLRLLLDIRPRELRPIPWELLFDPWREDFVGGRERVTLARYIPPKDRQPAAAQGQGLTILVIIAQASDDPPINRASEEQLIRQALAAEENAGRVRLIVRGGTVEEIRAGLAENPNVLHFIGHGQVHADGAPGLHLVGPRGYSLFADPVRLRREFFSEGRVGQLRLIVLNACQTSETPSTAGFDSLAYELISHVSSVVAMQYPVSDDSAAAFSGALYHHLAESTPLDEAVSRARQAIREGDLASQRDWLAPVLVSDGQDFILEREWMPFKGPNPYTVEDQSWFFGREDEAKNLRRQLELHPVVILHGPSNSGKTSLLNAGFLPQVGARQVAPTVPVEGNLEERLRAALDGWLQTQKLPPLSIGPLSAALEQLPRNLVIVLDRAEQAERPGAAQEVVRALSEWAIDSFKEKGGRRLVLAIREDQPTSEPTPVYLREVLSGSAPARLPLAMLDREAISEVIRQITEHTPVRFASEAIAQVLKALEYEQDPSMLKVQVVCRALYLRARELERDEVTPEMLDDKALGGVRGILERDYELAEKLRGAVAADGEAARDILIQFICSDGESARQVSEDLLTLRSGAASREVARQILDHLVEAGILRLERQSIKARPVVFYELVHWALIDKIKPWLTEEQAARCQIDESLAAAGSGLLRLDGAAGLKALAGLRARCPAPRLTSEQQETILVSVLEANFPTESEAHGELEAWLTALADPAAALAALGNPILSAQGRQRAAYGLESLASGVGETTRQALAQLLDLAVDDAPEVRQAAALALAPAAAPETLADLLKKQMSVPKERVIETLAMVYDASGKLPAGAGPVMSGKIRQKLLNLRKVQIFGAGLRCGLAGACGMTLVGIINWYFNVLEREADAALWAATLPVSLMAFLFGFLGSAWFAIGRDLAWILPGGRQARHAAFGLLAGGGMGMGITVFLFSMLVQFGQMTAFSWLPALEGLCFGLALAAGWLPALRREPYRAASTSPAVASRWVTPKWLAVSSTAGAGAAVLYLFVAMLSWWPDSFLLLTPDSYSHAPILGGLLGLFIALGLTWGQTQKLPKE